MTFSEKTEKRVISFVRTVANRCADCTRRNDGRCGNCLSSWANSIMVDINSDMGADSKSIDYTIATRIAAVIMALENADRPLRSSEIALDGTCSRQLKRWTLIHMTKAGRIDRKWNKEAKCYLYSVRRKI